MLQAYTLTLKFAVDKIIRHIVANNRQASTIVYRDMDASAANLDAISAKNAPITYLCNDHVKQWYGHVVFHMLFWGRTWLVCCGLHSGRILLRRGWCPTWSFNAHCDKITHSTNLINLTLTWMDALSLQEWKKEMHHQDTGEFPYPKCVVSTGFELRYVQPCCSMLLFCAVGKS